MPRYAVHLYAIVRVKGPPVVAENPQEAIDKAVNALPGLYNYFKDDNVKIDGKSCVVEFAESFESYLVDRLKPTGDDWIDSEHIEGDTYPLVLVYNLVRMIFEPELMPDDVAAEILQQARKALVESGDADSRELVRKIDAAARSGRQVPNDHHARPLSRGPQGTRRVLRIRRGDAGT